MSNDWYARKLSQVREQQGYAPAPPPTAHRGYPEPRVLQPAPQPAYQAPQPTYQQPQYQQQPGVVVEEPLNLHNFVEQMGRWRGGAAHRTDQHPCPECGSNLFFSRTNGGSRMAPPAPHCFSCGYNGQFTQGEAATWGGGSA